MPLPEDSPLLDATIDRPSYIGRYRIERQLGKGGFGVVYLAWDDKLQRLVAIKVPHASLVEASAEAEEYLKEARAVASLDHPHIVTVCDVGSAEGFPCFVVSKFIEGIDLAARLRQSRMEVGESVSLVARVAEALHHAHKQGLVHHDVKPRNILLDASGNPFVADFGLALREQDLSHKQLSADALAWMSPEKARGESHRVDRRSDIYSLGAIFYELLTGHPPFEANTRDELLAAMKRFEIKPPGEIVEAIPKELERICLKALARRASDRYPSAQEFAEDLRHWAIGSTAALGQLGSGKEVFLCFVPEDQEYAVKMCGLLEARGLSCWMAPRDLDRNIGPDESALRAIEATTTTVLLMSSLANESDEITRQIERATSSQKRVIPLRLENILLGKSLELHLSTSQWVDAWRLTPEQVARELILAHRNIGIGKEVFISYASQDQQLAFQLCKLLEEKAVNCWIAPRDVPPGKDFAEAIVDGIEGTSTTILLLTNFSNDSIHVAHEIERATSKRKRVIPVRLESIEPSRRLELHLSQTNWVDGWRMSPEQIAEEVVLAHRRPTEIGDSAAATSDDVESESRSAKIVPKGLRSFDENDADFFLELVPGPRDRNGLPDSIRFWKSRLEEKDANQTFSIGLIYGPSGCGKSSLVKAGLLPRLIRSLRVVYIEAGIDETESRLLNGLRRELPEMPEDLSLGEMLSAIRQGKFLAEGLKVVLIIDQFEQWLYAHRLDENTELAQALRHCDGGRLQCVVMVRDDFWMAATRFMQELEISLKENENAAPVDLFPVRHAEKVLTAFGRANGDLSAKSRDDTDEQRQFVEQAVAGLAEEGKVISVRLALFAEMVKGKPWSPATLRRIGGAQGVGEAFLEETFSSSAALPRYRVHQKAAQAVLRALLPESGSNIKGHMRSGAELLAASGYSNRLEDFEELIRIFDSEIRLITPADGVEAFGNDQLSGQNFYQLTHDYLVPSLKDWLTRKQKETPPGRAELLLEDRASIWKTREENRQLPSLIQWFMIRRWTRSRNWTPSQKKMMTRAGIYHGSRLAIFALVVAILSITGLTIRGQVIEQRNKSKAEALVQNLLTSETQRTPEIIREMADYRTWVLPFLEAKLAESPEDSRDRLHCSLALVEAHPEEVEYLYGRMFMAGPAELMVIREALAPHQAELKERLWSVLENSRGDAGEKLRAAVALSKYSASDPRWENIAVDVASMVAGQKAFVQLAWGESLKGAALWLLPPLRAFLIDEKRGLAERGLMASLYELFASGRDEAYAPLEEILTRSPIADTPPNSKFTLQKQQASVAIALMISGREEKGWPLFRHSPDPTVRTLLIDRMAPSGVEPQTLWNRLEIEPDTSARRALIQALGEFGLERLPGPERARLKSRLEAIYRDDPDAGVHSSTAYVLRKWGMNKEVSAIDQELHKAKPVAGRRWYVNGQGQTMSMITKPVVFTMGNGASESRAHRRRIDRSYAISSTEVTVEQFQHFSKNPFYDEQRSPTPDSPMNSVSWYEAAHFCNWLSEKEGIPKEQWCYVPNKEGMYAAGMGMKKDFMNLTGYRLPSEAEWENACRAGSDTVYIFGDSSEQLGNYAWYDITTRSAKCYPVGALRPNDHGLFDMHGNLWEWCQECYYQNYPISWKGSSIPDSQNDQTTIVQEEKSRVLRGGSFLYTVLAARSAYLTYTEPGNRSGSSGFRPARTFIP